MNESDTRIHKIDPQLKAAGWSVVEGSHISTEYRITRGKISQSVKMKGKKADYLLLYRGQHPRHPQRKMPSFGAGSPANHPRMRCLKAKHSSSGI